MGFLTNFQSYHITGLSLKINKYEHKHIHTLAHANTHTHTGLTVVFNLTQTTLAFPFV
jgi:hypothetical protein